MSFIPVGQKEEDTDARSRQIDEGKSVANSVALLKSMKDVKVQNVCGSTAGAGSGTFHKYRQCKRREQFRIDRLKKEEKIQKINERIRKRKRENEEVLEAKRSKKRKLRQKKKERRMRAKMQEKSGDGDGGEEQHGGDMEDADKSEGDGNVESTAEDEQLQELLNIDKALSKEQEQGDMIEGDGVEEKKSDHDVKALQGTNEQEKGIEKASASTDESKVVSKRDAILAALDAEFEGLND